MKIRRLILSVVLGLFPVIILLGICFLGGGSNQVEAQTTTGEFSPVVTTFLPLVYRRYDGPAILLHGGWSTDTVPVGWSVSFTLSTGESARWTGSQPEAGEFVGFVYHVRFRRLVWRLPEMVTATLPSGKVITKAIWVAPVSGDNAVTIESSCYSGSCRVDTFITTTAVVWGEWISTSATTLWHWGLRYPSDHPLWFTGYYSSFRFVLDDQKVVVLVLGENEVWMESSYNYCTRGEYLSGYYCANSYWTGLWDNTVRTTVLERCCQRYSDLTIDEEWYRHIHPSFINSK